VVEFLGAIQILIPIFLTTNMPTGVPGVLHGLTVDTAFFTGNYAPRFTLQAANLTPEVKFT
jgi:allantoicase